MNEAILLLYEAIIGTAHHILIQTYIGPVCMLGVLVVCGETRRECEEREGTL